MVFLCTNVDDYGMFSSDPDWHVGFLKNFNKIYEVKDEGPITRWFGINYVWSVDRQSVEIHQKDEILAACAQFGFERESTRQVSTPMETNFNSTKVDTEATDYVKPAYDFQSANGSQLWHARTSRSDVKTAVTFLCAHGANFSEYLVDCSKRIFRYFISTIDDQVLVIETRTSTR